MRISIKNVQPLEQFSAQDFSRWLRRGFADLYHKDRRITAFSPMHYYVRRRGEITGELNDIYNALSGSAQEQFRIGIAIALSELPPKYYSVPIARSLLYLAGAVHAPEIVPEVIRQIKNGLFGLSRDIQGVEIFALILETIGSMSPAYGVGDAVRRLIYSFLFQEDYAPMAFIALCRTEPEQFPKHMKLLRESFAALHRKEGTADTFLTAHRFAKYVDLTLIGCKISKLQLIKKPGIDELNTDNWLVEALFCGENAPLDLDKNENQFIITRRDMKQIQPPMEIFLKTDSDTFHHVYDVKEFLDVIVTTKLKHKPVIADNKGVSGATLLKIKTFEQHRGKPMGAPYLPLIIMDEPNNKEKKTRP